MKKKILVIILGVVIILGGLFIYWRYSSENNSNGDAIKFKEEYESLNGVINEKNNKEYRSVSIDSDNPMIYKSADDIVNMINNKETFVVYFGFDSCPWCRSVILTLIEVAKDTGVSEVYYVDVKEIRDVIEVNSEGKLETTKEGTEGYYKLIDSLDSVLNDYNITDSNGKEVSTNEKRIYAPNIVAVVNGQAEKMESGISEKQTDGYMELTDEMKEDSYNKIKSVLDYINKEQNTCDTGC